MDQGSFEIFLATIGFDANDVIYFICSMRYTIAVIIHFSFLTGFKTKFGDFFLSSFFLGTLRTCRRSWTELDSRLSRDPGKQKALTILTLLHNLVLHVLEDWTRVQICLTVSLQPLICSGRLDPVPQ